MASLPYNIIVAPYEVYLAPVGESFPVIDATPAGNWDLLGTSGNKDYAEEGVRVTHEQTINQFRFLGTTGPRKASRVSEGLTIEFTLHDLSLIEYAKVLNGATVTDTAAAGTVAGHQSINILQGFAVNTLAMLIKGDGPYGDEMPLQYEVPMVFRDGSPTVVFNKSEVAGLNFTWVALEDPNNPTAAGRFGVIRAMDEVAPS